MKIEKSLLELLYPVVILISDGLPLLEEPLLRLLLDRNLPNDRFASLWIDKADLSRPRL